MKFWTVAAILLISSAAVAAELPVLKTAPGLDPDQWNLWSDTYLAYLDGGDVRGLLEGASAEDLRALARQAQLSLDTASNAVERGHLTAIRYLLSAARAGTRDGFPPAAESGGRLPAAKPAPAAAPAPEAIVTQPFFPLHANDTWWLKDANTNEDFTLQVVGQVPVNGTSAWKMKRSRPNNQEEWDAMTSDAKGINLHVRFIRGNNAVLTPPVLFAPSSTDVGQVYTTTPSFPNPATGNKTVWTVKIEKLEDVTVPAGTFKGCMKVNMLIKDSSLGTVLSKIDLWVAPKVGFVKRVGQFFGVFFVESLQKYSVAP